MATKTITAERSFYSVSQGWRNGDDDGCRQGWCGWNVGLIVGYLRFPSVSILDGATINKATLTVTLDSNPGLHGADKTLALHGYWTWDGEHINDDEFDYNTTATVKNGGTYDIDVKKIIVDSGQQYKTDIKIYCFINEEKLSGYNYSQNYLIISSASLKIDYTEWTPVGMPGKPQAEPIKYNHERYHGYRWYFKGADPTTEGKITWKWTAANEGNNNKVENYIYTIYRKKSNEEELTAIEGQKSVAIPATQTKVSYSLTVDNRGDCFCFRVLAKGERDESNPIDSDYYYVNYAPSANVEDSYLDTMDLSQDTYTVEFNTLDPGGTLHGQESTSGPMYTQNSVHIGDQTKTNTGAGKQMVEFNTSEFHKYAGSSCIMYITANDGMVETTTKEYTIKVGKSLNFGLELDGQILKMTNVYIDGKVDHSNQTTGTLLVYDFQSKTYCDLGITKREWHISDIMQKCISNGYPLTKGSFLDSEGKLSIQCKGKSNGSQGLTNTATTTVAISDMNINNNDVSIVIDGGYRAESTHPELVNGLKVKVKYALSNDLVNVDKGTLWFNYKFSYTTESGSLESEIGRPAEWDGEFYTTTFSADDIAAAAKGYAFSIDVQPVFKIGDKTAAIGEYISGLYNGTISTFQPYIPATLSLYEGTDGLDKEALAPSDDPDSITLPLIMEGDKATRYYKINKVIISYGNGSVEVPLGYKVNTLIVGSDQSIYPTKNAMLKVAATIASGVEKTKDESGVESLIKYAEIMGVTITPVNLGDKLGNKSSSAEIRLNLDANENIVCKLEWQEMLKVTDGNFDQPLSEQTSELKIPISTFSKPYFKNDTTLTINFEAVNSNG